MFRGSSDQTMDPKGRITIPSRFREVLRAGSGGADAMMLTRLEGCVYGFTLDEWEKFERRILTNADTSDKMRWLRRYVVGSAFECTCDKQGRVLIPPTLRIHAALEKEIVLVGLLDHFEVWSRENWDRQNEAMENELQKGGLREEIARLGL